jgi:hypothetical protein
VLATSADGTQYTTGWVNSVFTVPYDVPDTIYYKCSNHNNMGGDINTTFGNTFSLGDFTVAANTHVLGEYTLAVNYNGTMSNLYVDGSLITQTTPTPAISAGTKDFILGKEFDGYVKNFKFWNYAKRFIPIITIPITIAFHYNTFSSSDYGGVYTTVSAATTAGHVYSDSPSGTYTWGTLGTPSTASNQTTYTWTPLSSITGANVLMVAGGGGGSYSAHSYAAGAGGGAGGIVFAQNENISGQKTIIVGNGGSGGNGGTNGQNTIALNYTALGGGGGAQNANIGQDGGSGGGDGATTQLGGSGLQPTSISGGFGNDGGVGGGASTGGGGGGAGGVGQNGGTSGTGNGGNGGAGKDYSLVFGTIYGENGIFSGGGGAGTGNGGSIAGTGGLGGGGDGGLSGVQGGNGTNHTGGGGGGCIKTATPGGGGSGIVLIKY